MNIEGVPRFLYTGVIAHPMEISIDIFTQTLSSSSKAFSDKAHPYVGPDKNVLYLLSDPMQALEYYIYKSDLSGLGIKTSNFIEEGAVSSYVRLPVCGVVIEVDTTNLNVKKVTSILKNANNEPLEEWVVDEIPESHYHVKKLALTKGKNDKLEFDYDLTTPDVLELQNALAKIKFEFKRKEKAAKTYASFIDTLTPAERMNEFVIKREWRSYVESAG